MPSKIRVRVGQIEVEYEGPDGFLDKKLLDMIRQLSEISKSVPESAGGTGSAAQEAGDPGTLASFLNSKNATSSQVKKFLATAQWLHLKGKRRLKTGDVTKALRDNSQARLGNASNTLSRNITKGFCERDGSEFYVTSEGIADLG